MCPYRFCGEPEPHPSEELIRRAKVTVNAFVRKVLGDVLSRESRARKAARRLLRLAGQGLRG